MMVKPEGIHSLQSIGPIRIPHIVIFQNKKYHDRPKGVGESLMLKERARPEALSQPFTHSQGNYLLSQKYFQPLLSVTFVPSVHSLPG